MESRIFNFMVYCMHHVIDNLLSDSTKELTYTLKGVKKYSSSIFIENV